MHLALTVVTEIARLLYGDDWQRPLARGLGPLHPEGARDTIDPRLVRRWASEERPIPTWVGGALVTLLEEEAVAHIEHAQACRDRAADLNLSLDAARG